MDTVMPETRSRMMRAVRGKDAKPELIVRHLAHAMGFRFRLHRSPAASALTGPKDVRSTSAGTSPNLSGGSTRSHCRGSRPHALPMFLRYRWSDVATERSPAFWRRSPPPR